MAANGSELSSPCLKSKTCSTENVVTLQLKYGDGHAEEERETRGLVVWRRVAQGARSPLLQAGRLSQRCRVAGTGLLPEDRLRFHQEHSGPLMKGLHEWM